MQRQKKDVQLGARAARERETERDVFECGSAVAAAAAMCQTKKCIRINNSLVYSSMAEQVPARKHFSTTHSRLIVHGLSFSFAHTRAALIFWPCQFRVGSLLLALSPCALCTHTHTRSPPLSIWPSRSLVHLYHSNSFRCRYSDSVVVVVAVAAVSSSSFSSVSFSFFELHTHFIFIHKFIYQFLVFMFCACVCFFLFVSIVASICIYLAIVIVAVIAG